LQVNPAVLVPLVAAVGDDRGGLMDVRLEGRAAGLEVPILAESGPIPVRSSSRNVGDSYARAFTTVEWSNWGRPYYTQELAPMAIVNVFPP
jgi:hypothetical protein